MMKERIMRRLAVSCAFFTVTAIALMLLYMKNRTYVYASGGTLEETDATLAEQIRNMSLENLTELNIIRRQEDGILIPIHDGITEENISMVTDSVNRNVRVYIDGLDENYFNAQRISADQSRVTGCRIGYENGITQLMFRFDSTYECRISKENGNLRIKLYRPREIYDFIVLVDVGHGSSDAGDSGNGVSEKKIILKIAEKLHDIVGEASIGLYFTRLSDVELTDEDRLRLVKSTDADILISIHTAISEDPEMFGVNVYYNGTYFTNALPSVQLADMMARNVAGAVYGRANGIYPADAMRPLVYDAQVPAIELEVGHLSNAAEAGLLMQEEYQQRIAEGIYQTICDAQRAMEER